MRTTVRLDQTILLQAKRRALEEGTTLTALFEAALREKLAGRPVTPPPSQRRPLPVFHGRGQQPGVDLHDGSALLDLMQGDVGS